MPDFILVSGFEINGPTDPVPAQDFQIAETVLKKFGFSQIAEHDSMVVAMYNGNFAEFPALDKAITAAFAASLSMPVAFREPAESQVVKAAFRETR